LFAISLRVELMLFGVETDGRRRGFLYLLHLGNAVNTLDLISLLRPFFDMKPTLLHQLLRDWSPNMRHARPLT